MIRTNPIRPWLLPALAIAACLGLAVVANASSPPAGKLTGHIDPSGHATLNISYRTRDHTKYRSYTWSLRRVPLKCKGGPAIARDRLTGGVMLRNKGAGHKPFGLGVSSSGPNYKASVTGHMVSRNKARGIVHVSGSEVPLSGGGHDKCDSGLLHWQVTR